MALTTDTPAIVGAYNDAPAKETQKPITELSFSGGFLCGAVGVGVGAVTYYALHKLTKMDFGIMAGLSVIAGVSGFLLCKEIKN